MNIIFKTRKLEKTCNDIDEAQRQWGTVNGKLVVLRLQQLGAADNLEIAHMLHQARCHELKGDRKGQYAVDLKHPYRLIFEPAHDPVPKKADGGIALERVTAIRILEVKDYHGQ